MPNEGGRPRTRAHRAVQNNRHQREELIREIQHNEEQLFSMLEPAAANRLALEEQGVRERLPRHVLRVERYASNICTDSLNDVLRAREQNQTLEDYMFYNQEVLRTLRIFQLYRRFQQWQAAQLQMN